MRSTATCVFALTTLLTVAAMHEQQFSAADVLGIRKKLEGKQHSSSTPRRQPAWVPGEDTGIVLSNWCRMHGMGCSREYLEWLQQQVSSSPGEETCATNGELIDDDETAAAVHRQLELLQARLLEEQQAHVELLSTLLLSRQETAVCPPLLAVNIGLMSDHVLVASLAWGARMLEWCTSVWLPVVMQHVAPCTLTVALLLWALLECHMEPHVLHYVQGGAADAPPTARLYLGEALLGFLWLERIHRLRLLMSLSMLVFVLYSMWALGTDLWSRESGGVFWVLSYIIPQRYLWLGTIVVTASYTLGTLFRLGSEVNAVVSDHLDASSQVARQYDEALHRVVVAHHSANGRDGRINKSSSALNIKAK
ncbi:unnamed protein product [Bodo saltans]|uniref:Membrane-associated protein n=1 Tax=Bodo saltans TaxID=75058 RepID=A0A0S4KH42_BODSA|nr:unnamed protein product [Bodo saltans]|eukprot:CUI15002.1 unnamed protein product [Bodo saltans]